MTAKDLKNALLQEAVQGKLVPQIASEGNARDLLEEIRKEKLSHGFANSYGICDEKGKKSKSSDLRSKSQIRVTKKELPDITEDEIPFEIPESWCWCRLGEIINIKSGDGLTSSQMEKGNIPVFGGNGITGYHNISNIHKESIVIGRVGFYCGSVHITPNEAWVTDNAFITTYPEKQIDKRFLVYVLRHLNLGQDNNATAQPVVSGKKIYPIPFPLPPLAEQKRIVAAIEKFMPLIEEYGKKETQLKAINEKIGTLTKKAILQEAVQGKLVPQIAAEGNARDLLEEIRKEKLSHGFANSYGICDEKGKKSKSSDLRSKSQIRVTKKELPEITEDEIPFDIPESWCWCRLGEICTKLVDGDHNPPAGLQEKTEYLMLSSRNINDDKLVDLDLVRYLSKEVFEKENERTKAEKGDIFFTSVGTLGRSCIFDGSINVSFQRSVSIIKTEIFNYYLKYCLDSGYVQNFVVKNATGTAQKGFYLNQLAELIIPLPPLAEQKRIVAAIEKMLPLCEKLGE